MKKKPLGRPVQLDGVHIVKASGRKTEHPALGWKLSTPAKKDIAEMEANARMPAEHIVGARPVRRPA